MVIEFAFPPTAEERAKLFHEAFDPSNDATSTLVELVTAVGRFLANIVGNEAANDAMAELTSCLTESAGGGGERVRSDNWAEVLAASSEMYFSEWPIGVLLHDLSAFANYGIVLHSAAEVADREDYLRGLIERARAFLKSAPMVEWNIQDRMMEKLLTKAEGRWAVDHGQPVKPEALASLGGLSEGRIRNMMSGAGRVFSNKGGLIPADEALAWLSDRREYASSLWQDQSLRGYGSEAGADLDDVVFVPVARDGSVFHPGLLTNSNFTIGGKSAERHVAEFSDALSQLQKMTPAPYWRRPNDQGNWGIVRGLRWERMELRDLEAFSADPNKRLHMPTI